MIEDDVLERGELVAQEIEPPQPSPALRREPSGRSSQEAVTTRLQQESLGRSEAPDELKELSTGKPRRTGLLGRGPFISAVGAVLLASALGGGYLSLDYGSRFQSTDDAFVAARQSALAPKVSGYISAVPVTDNQHVKTGDVIARIDDRNYRTALEQAEAQVAAAQARTEKLGGQRAREKAQD